VDFVTRPTGLRGCAPEFYVCVLLGKGRDKSSESITISHCVLPPASSRGTSLALRHEARCRNIEPIAYTRKRLAHGKTLEQRVKEFQPDESSSEDIEYDDVLREALHVNKECFTEANEQDYIENQVLAETTERWRAGVRRAYWT